MESKKTKLSPQEKIAWARESYAALNAGDIEKGLEGFSEDLVFHSPVFPQPLGKDALRAATKRILDTTDEYSLEAHDILANDDHIVALLVVHGRRGDRGLKERRVHVMHVNEDGPTEPETAGQN
jgi:ketosteroid isomerase-like protein